MASKLTQLRTLNGDFARSYKYNFTIEEPAGAALLDLKSGFSAPGGAFDALISTSCVNVVWPAVGSQEIAVEVGLHTMRLNGRHETSGVISPEFLIGGDYSVYKFFRDWAGLAASHSVDTQVRNSNILASITIVAKDINDVTQQSVRLQNAWCRNCPEVNFSDDSNDIIRFAPEIVYDYAV